MKILIFMLLLSQSAFSRTFFITDDSTGEKFQCTPYNEQQNNITLDDPTQPTNKCAAEVWKFCRSNAQVSDDACMAKANKVCKFPYVKLLDCVKREFKGCRPQEALGPSVCFDHAVFACEMIVR